MNISAVNQEAYKSEKITFYNSLLKWASTNTPLTENMIVDIPQIATILQALDFKLELIDYVSNDNQNSNEMEIEVKCKKSGMRIILSKQDTVCICPNSKTVKEILAKKDSTPLCNQNNEMYNTLIPQVSKEKTLLLKDVMFKLFTVIAGTDMNQNENNEKVEQSFKNSSCKFRSLDDLSKPQLVREGTWEVDPKTSPPIGTSSPIPKLKLNSTIEQSSSVSDKEQILADILQNVKENLEKAMGMLTTKNNTFTKTNVKRVSNIKVSPTVMTPTRSTTGKSTPDFPVQKTPVKKIKDEITPKSTAATVVSVEKRYPSVASKIGSFRKKNAVTLKPKFINKDTLLSVNKQVSPNPVSITSKKMIGTLSKSSSLRGSNSNIAGTTPNTSKAKSGIPSFGFKSLAKK